MVSEDVEVEVVEFVSNQVSSHQNPPRLGGRDGQENKGRREGGSEMAKLSASVLLSTFFFLWTVTTVWREIGRLERIQGVWMA